MCLCGTMLYMIRLAISSILLVALALLLYPQMLYLLLVAPFAFAIPKVRKKTKEAAGICADALQSSAKKEENKRKIMEMFEGKNELTNEEIRKKLNVSRGSVVNYMNELEKEGKVEQVGDVGRSTHYVLKKS